MCVLHARAHSCRVEHNYERFYIMEGPVHTDIPEEKTYHMQWKLPQGLSCTHCVVMLTWWTAQHCAYPDCPREVCGYYADGLNLLVRPDKTTPYPTCERFEPLPDTPPQVRLLQLQPVFCTNMCHLHPPFCNSCCVGKNMWLNEKLEGRARYIRSYPHMLRIQAQVHCGSGRGMKSYHALLASR